MTEASKTYVAELQTVYDPSVSAHADSPYLFGAQDDKDAEAKAREWVKDDLKFARAVRLVVKARGSPEIILNVVINPSR